MPISKKTLITKTQPSPKTHPLLYYRYSIMPKTKTCPLAKHVHYFHHQKRYFFRSRSGGTFFVERFVRQYSLLQRQDPLPQGEYSLPQRWNSLAQSRSSSTKRNDSSPPPQRQYSLPQSQHSLLQRRDPLPQRQYSLLQSQDSLTQNNDHEDMECACVCYHLQKPFASELETTVFHISRLSGLRNPLHIYA